ncbi:MAG: hypothetical protein HY900_10515 [Deltaproteobacteria bacterium]|nr:hypothetical protein [Deltaproteobacteria bacterium]
MADAGIARPGLRAAVVLHSEGSDASSAASDVCAGLVNAAYAAEARAVTAEDLLATTAELALRRDEIAVVNLCGALDRNPQHAPLVAALLAFHGLRFAGNGARTLTCALDKRLTKAILSAAGIPTPGARVFRTAPHRDAVRDMAFPLVVKPLRAGPGARLPLNSFVRTPDELCRRVEEVLDSTHQPALAEVYLDGREFGVAVSGRGRVARAVSVMEIAFGPSEDERPRVLAEGVPFEPRCPAEMGEHLRVSVATAALAAYRALECCYCAWIGLRLDGRGNPHVFGVDTAPDLSRAGPFARAVEASGDTYEDFLERLVEDAWNR